MDAVVFEGVAKRLRGGDIIDGHDIEMATKLGDPRDGATDSAESIDGDPRNVQLSIPRDSSIRMLTKSGRAPSLRSLAEGFLRG